MFFVRLRVLTAALVAVLLTAGIPSQGVQAQTGERCFPETGFCISGRIRDFWEKNGGLAVFGFPIAPQQEQTIEGKQVQAQNFERNRLELHPENKAPYDVLLGRLGADRLNQLGKDWQTYPKSGPQDGCRYFAETGQSVCGNILRAWRANGLEIDGKKGKTEAENLALFGLPLSPLVTEKQADGKERQVQWFERARFELHPENQPPYDVLLGLLGNEIRDNVGAKADPCADVKDPVNGRIRPSKCVTRGTTILMDVFGFQPNEQIGFWLTAPDGSMLGTVRTLDIGPTGSAENLDWNTSDMPSGIWYWVFEGVSSKRQSIIWFKVLDPAGSGGGAPSGGTLPASVNSTVSPDRGARGTVFRATAHGFVPGERAGVYITAPDRSVYGAPFQVDTDDRGVAEVVTVNSGVFPPSATGVWAITFEGIDSGRKAIAYFEVTP